MTTFLLVLFLLFWTAVLMLLFTHGVRAAIYDAVGAATDRSRALRDE